MNPDLKQLQGYPFARLRALLEGASPPPGLSAISLAIGEPQHAPPACAVDALTGSLNRLNAYPPTLGEPTLREAIADWIQRRYQMRNTNIDPDTMVLPVLGSREALFAVAQAVVDRHSGSQKPLVMMPSPFYQIYEGAAIMSGAEPRYMPVDSGRGYIADLESVTADEWQRCQLIYVCNPSNPTGAVLSETYFRKLLELADKYGFVIASDECYSEIYSDEQRPCTGLLEVCDRMGRRDFARCLVFNSLSKRSNLAGMRSGFIAGDTALIKAFLLYRTYHGSAMPFHHQAASVAAWRDEQHVTENRVLYRQKLQAVTTILKQHQAVEIPDGGFCLWFKTAQNDEQFTRQLYEQQHVTLLPGSYLARNVDGINPGKNYVRIALVQPLETCIEAARRMADFLVK